MGNVKQGALLAGFCVLTTAGSVWAGGGFHSNSSGGGAVSSANMPDPYVPVDGTANITGALTVSSTITGDSVQATGAKSNFKNADFTGQVDSASVFTGLYFADHATASCKATPLAATGWTLDVPAGKGYFFQSNSVEVAKISSVGAITPGDNLSGAAAITWVGIQAYTIDFAAFTAGVNDTSAQAMTGVLMGDTCTVSSATDLSASIGQLSARPTSAGNIIVIASGVSTVSTANPASDTFTVRCAR